MNEVEHFPEWKNKVHNNANNITSAKYVNVYINDMIARLVRESFANLVSLESLTTGDSNDKKLKTFFYYAFYLQILEQCEACEITGARIYSVLNALDCKIKDLIKYSIENKSELINEYNLLLDEKNYANKYDDFINFLTMMDKIYNPSITCEELQVVINRDDKNDNYSQMRI